MAREENLGSVVGPQGPRGETGQKGADGATWLFGSAAPTTSQGKDGDHFLHTGTYDIYHKASSAWAKDGNIKGAKGDTGATGAPGPKGDTGATGPIGPTGPVGDKGPQGVTGTAGPKGADGITPRFEIRNGILYAIFDE